MLVTAPPPPPRSARRLFARTVLISEVLVVLFATLVAHGLHVADRGLVWAVGGGLMLLAAVAAGLPPRRGGLALGSAVQVLVLLAGIWVPGLIVVGAIFAVLWVVCWRLGGRIDVERAERYEDELAHHATTHGTASAGPARSAVPPASPPPGKVPGRDH